MPPYHGVARILSKRRLSPADVTFFAMDEWANQLGENAPGSWEGSFQFPLRTQCFDCIDPNFMPPKTQFDFPSSATIDDYGKRTADAGGADAGFGGIRWNRDIGFWKPHLGHEFGGDLAAYGKRVPTSSIFILLPSPKPLSSRLPATGRTGATSCRDWPCLNHGGQAPQFLG